MRKQCFTQSESSSRSIQAKRNTACRNEDRDTLAWILIGHDQDHCHDLSQDHDQAKQEALLGTALV